MSLLETAARTFINKLGADGEGLDMSSVSQALGRLLGESGGDLDFGALLGRLQGGSLASLAASWLGDGPNAAVSSEQLADLFDGEALNGFASRVGLDEGLAERALAQTLPELIDSNSRGGALVGALTGNSGGLMGMARKLFGR